MRHCEIGKLRQYEAELQSRGEMLQIEDFFPSQTVPDEANVWTHPFLKLLATASQVEGEEARKQMYGSDDTHPYKRLRIPEVDGLRYADDFTGDFSIASLGYKCSR